MTYKQWATDKTLLPEGPGDKILAKVQRGAPSIILCAQMIEVKLLADCGKKCKRLNPEQRGLRADFLDHEKRSREK